MSGVLASHQHGKSRVRVGRTFRSSIGTCSWRALLFGVRQSQYPSFSDEVDLRPFSDTYPPVVGMLH
jgi:hypothetical protein